MATKGLILLGVALLTLVAIRQTPRALERGVRQYLLATFPNSKVRVRITAPTFWFSSGDLKHITIEMAHFDASKFPIPTIGHAPGGDPFRQAFTNSSEPTARGQDSPALLTEDAGQTPGASSTVGASSTPASTVEPGPAPSSNPTLKMDVVRWARIDNVDMNLTDFRFYGRHVANLRVSLPNVLYDFTLAKKERLLRLGGSGEGKLQVTLSDEDLNQAVEVDRPDIRELRVHVENNQIRVTLDYHMLVGWVPVTVTGQLALVQGHAIYLTDPQISAVRVTFPQAVTDYILKRVQNINPVFDLSRLNLPMKVELTGIQAGPGSLTLYAAAKLPDA